MRLADLFKPRPAPDVEQDGLSLSFGDETPYKQQTTCRNVEIRLDGYHAMGALVVMDRSTMRATIRFLKIAERLKGQGIAFKGHQLIIKCLEKERFTVVPAHVFYDTKPSAIYTGGGRKFYSRLFPQYFDSLQEAAILEMAAKQEPIVTNYEQACVYAQMHPEEFPWIADIDKFKLHRRIRPHDQFVVFHEDTAIAYYELNEINSSQAILKNVYVAPSGRGNKLTAKFMWFARTNLGYSRIILDYRHSAAMRNQIVGLTNNFKVSWINTATNEVVPFDKNNPDTHYFTEIGPDRENWTVMFEGSGYKPMPTKQVVYVPGDPMPEWDQIYECHFPQGRDLDGISDGSDTSI